MIVEGTDQVWPIEPAPVPLDLRRLAQASETSVMLISRDDLFSGYVAEGASFDTRLNSFSLVKSLVGVLVLKAHSDGILPDLDAPLAMFVPNLSAELSVRQALDMTSGLVLPGEPPKQGVEKPFDDADFSPFSPLGIMHAFGLPAVLDDMRVDPSRMGNFHYQSVNTALLGQMLEALYGQSLNEILSVQIWKPAGARDAFWRTTQDGATISAYCCLYATAQDWVRVGRFLLENGRPDSPFLSPSLWEEWILPSLPPEERRAGVYRWHLRHDVLDRPGAAVSGPFSYMMGHGGQVVYFLPQQDTVIVRFGAKPQKLHSSVYHLFGD